MSAQYFADCSSVEEIKTLYRELARKLHPDLNPEDPQATAKMQELNSQYHTALRAANGQTSQGSDGKEHTYRYNHETEQAIIEKISELLALGMLGTEIYLIGSWVWIMGETKPYRESLKELGCRWHSKRGCWYWQQDGYRHRYSQASLSDLASKYGCSRFDKEEEDRKPRKRISA